MREKTFSEFDFLSEQRRVGIWGPLTLGLVFTWFILALLSFIAHGTIRTPYAIIAICFFLSTVFLSPIFVFASKPLDPFRHYLRTRSNRYLAKVVLWILVTALGVSLAATCVRIIVELAFGAQPDSLTIFFVTFGVILFGFVGPPIVLRSPKSLTTTDWWILFSPLVRYCMVFIIIAGSLGLLLSPVIARLAEF